MDGYSHSFFFILAAGRLKHVLLINTIEHVERVYYIDIICYDGGCHLKICASNPTR